MTHCMASTSSLVLVCIKTQIITSTLIINNKSCQVSLLLVFPSHARYISTGLSKLARLYCALGALRSVC